MNSPWIFPPDDLYNQILDLANIRQYIFLYFTKFNLEFIVQRTVTMSMYWGDFTCFTATTHFVANYVEFCKKRNFTGSSRFITVLHKQGGGLPRPPNCIMLRNIWTAPYGGCFLARIYQVLKLSPRHQKVTPKKSNYSHSKLSFVHFCDKMSLFSELEGLITKRGQCHLFKSQCQGMSYQFTTMARLKSICFDFQAIHCGKQKWWD